MTNTTNEHRKYPDHMARSWICFSELVTFTFTHILHGRLNDIGAISQIIQYHNKRYIPPLMASGLIQVLTRIKCLLMICTLKCN